MRVDKLRKNVRFRPEKDANFALLFSTLRSKLLPADDLLQQKFSEDLASMHQPELYSIQEARKLLGGISRNMIYQLLRSGELASVIIGCRRFISAAAIAELITRSTTSVSPA